jgi:hypothetical protein
LPQSLPLRPVALALACTLLAVVLASCGGGGGSGSGTTSSSNPQGAQQRRGFGALAGDPKVRACLQKQGVTLPSRPNGPGGNGGPPSGGGTPGGRRPGQNSARFQKLQKALKACGVTLPAPGQGGPAGSSQTQTSS